MSGVRIRLSVVIPVYNTEKWLGECLDSILAQDAFDSEVVCVDDGSTDGSPDILAEYAGKDSRVKVILQKNRGVSSARNVGMDAAQGEYIWFFDSDDSINPETMQAVYRAVETNDRPQLVCFPTVRILDSQSCRRFRRKNRETGGNDRLRTQLNGIHTGPEVMQTLLEESLQWHWVWAHLIRRDFLAENGLRFQESLFRHEDYEFMTRVYRDAVSVLYVPEVVSNHRIREGSSVDAVRKKVLARDVMALFDCIAKIYGIYSGSEMLQQNVPAFETWLLQRTERCQKYYSRLIRDNPESGISFPAGEENKTRLFDMLIRYPVETGGTLFALSRAEAELASRPYRLFSWMAGQVRKLKKRI